MRHVRSVAKWLAVVACLIVAYFLGAQHGMIYHPRPYKAAEIGAFQQIEALWYSTSEGRQQCYFVPARSETLPQSPIWVVFSGNGSRALDWMNFIHSYPAAKEAFLLVDYPGYGLCAGSPSPKSIQESSSAALAALAAHLGSSVSELEPRLRVLGHSLGSATALMFASTHPVSRIVLLAPFTSMRAMAQRTVGWPLCYLLLDNFDNAARLQEITRRAPSPSIHILSGTQDSLIPFTMGEQLARSFPPAHFETVADAGHNDIIARGEAQILQP